MEGYECVVTIVQLLSGYWLLWVITGNTRWEGVSWGAEKAAGWWNFATLGLIRWERRGLLG
jgi:hypothetical protein